MTDPDAPTLRVLGGLALERGGRAVELPQSRKTRALLAYLAVTGVAHTREDLCAMFWNVPDDPRGALRWSLSKLRGLVDEPGRTRIVADRKTVAFAAEGAEIDLAAARAAVERGLDGLPDDALVALEARCAGRFLAGLALPNCPAFETWCAGMRDEVARLHGRILRALLMRPLGRPELAKRYSDALEQLDLPSEPPAAAPREMSPGEAPLALPDKPSIAVLPFGNLSDDPDQDYFADGIAEDIITGLSRIRWLFVIARTSSFLFKDARRDIPDVARALGVRYVLDGSVRRAGNRIRVNALLADAPSRRHIWAERYDRDLKDIFAVQDEITEAIVAAIEPEMGGAEQARALVRPPENLDAWGSYHRGLWHIYRFTRDDTAQALPLFHRAIALDPRFGPAHAGASMAHFSNAFLRYTPDRDAEVAAALAEARTAIEIDDRDPFAHWSLARAYFIAHDLDHAIPEFETAIELNPSYAQAHYNLGWALMLAGRPLEAIESCNRAIRLSPRDPLLFAFLNTRAQSHVLLGQLDEALVWVRKAVRQPNAHEHILMTCAMILGLRGEIDAARRMAGQALARRPDYNLALFQEGFPFRHAEHLELFLKGFRAAGVPD